MAFIRTRHILVYYGISYIYVSFNNGYPLLSELVTMYGVYIVYIQKYKRYTGVDTRNSLVIPIAGFRLDKSSATGRKGSSVY